MTVTERSQPTESLQSASIHVLRTQIARIWKASPFYARHWLNAGLAVNELPDSYEDLAARWPTVSKADVLADQSETSPHGTNLCVDPKQLAQIHLTSNTSGVGRELYGLTSSDVAAMGHSWLHQFDAIDLTDGDVAFAMLPVSFMTAGLSAMEGTRAHGLVGIATGLADKDWIIDSMVKFGPALVYGTESFLLQLMWTIRERGIAMPRTVKGVVVPGASRQLIEMSHQLLGSDVFEVYGCTQAATRIATTCRLGVEGGSLHLHAGQHFIEVVGCDGSPVEPGEYGEVILTTLSREASPSVRFRMADRVRLNDGPCACGTPGRTLEPMSIGRVDDMVKVKGANIWPDSVHRAVMEVADVIEYRVELLRRVDGGEQFKIFIETTRTDEELRQTVETRVRSATYVRPIVEFATGLPRHDYKARRWTDRRNSDRDGSHQEDT